MNFPGEFYQIGVVTDNLERTMAEYSALGATAWKQMATRYQGRYREWMGEIANRNAFARWQGVMLELVEPGEGQSTAREWLDSRGPGLFHLGFICDDMSVRPLGADICFESFGKLTAQGGPAVVHLDTLDSLGYFVELADRPLAEELIRWMDEPASAD